MKKLVFTILVLLVSTAVFAAEKVTIYAAASTTDMLNEVIALYNKAGGDVVPSYASSGSLARQIEQDAPAAIFVSANQEWMDYLEEKGFVEKTDRSDWLGNILVLVAPADSKSTFKFAGKKTLIKELGKDKLSMGDPNHVPAGQYAKEAFEKLGLWKDLEPKVILADNVRVALMYVARGETPLGVVFGSDAVASKDIKVLDEFPADSYGTISYPIGFIKGKKTAEAEKFYMFLQTDEVKEIVKKYGFAPL